MSADFSVFAMLPVLMRPVGGPRQRPDLSHDDPQFGALDARLGQVLLLDLVGDRVALRLGSQQVHYAAVRAHGLVQLRQQRRVAGHLPRGGVAHDQEVSHVGRQLQAGKFSLMGRHAPVNARSIELTAEGIHPRLVGIDDRQLLEGGCRRDGCDQFRVGRVDPEGITFGVARCQQLPGPADCGCRGNERLDGVRQ